MANKFDILFEIDGKEVYPANWQSLQFSSTFDDNAQPVIITDEFTFVNEGAKLISEWFAKYPFQGMPFTIQLFNGQAYTKTGCIDFNDYEIVKSGVKNGVEYIVEVKCKIKLDDNLDLLDEQLRAVSYGYLAREGGVISQSDYTDVPVVVRRKFDGVEVAMASLSIYLITKELYEGLDKLKEKWIENVVVVLSSPTQKPAQIVKAILYAIVLIAYYALMLIAIYRFIKVLQENLLPTKTTYKGITERKALEKACEHFGVTLDCNIPEIDYTIYLPSKTDNRTRKNRRDEGIPNVSDYGYQVSEMFEIILKKYLAKSKKIGNTLYIRAENDSFWFDTSTYVLPSNIELEKYRYNIEDLKANYFISFQYDYSDEWTLPNSRQKPLDNNDKDFITKQHDKGVAYELITDISNPLNVKYKQNRGLQEVRIPLALGQRKNDLSVLEQSMKALFVVVDLVIKLFGGKTFAEKINDHKGHLIISQPSFNVAKNIVLQGGLIPLNHRELLSAEKLYSSYHSVRSFKTNPTYSQRRVYTDIKIPFDFSDFLITIENCFFTTEDGKKGKFTKLDWSADKDYAIASFWIAEQYIDPNTLIETNIIA